MSAVDPTESYFFFNTGYPIRTVALGVGIPLILVCLCLFGTAAAVLSSLAVKRKRGKINGVGNLIPNTINFNFLLLT